MSGNSARCLTALFVATLLLASGCGTLDANIQITVKDTGEVITKTAMRGTGALGNALLTPGGEAEPGQGWL